MTAVSFIDALRITSGYQATKAAQRRAEKGLGVAECEKTSASGVVLFVVRSKTVTPDCETAKVPHKKNRI